MSFYRLIWLLPIAFLIHVGEEYFIGYPAYAGELTGAALAAAIVFGGLFTGIVAAAGIYNICGEGA